MAFLATPFAVATGLGLSSSAYFFFGNLGLATCGPIRFVTDPAQRTDLGIDADRAVALWARMYDWGAAQFAPASLTTTAAFLAASLLAKRGGHARFAALADQTLVSRLLLASSLVSLSILPYTLAVMFPNIKKLLAQRDRIRAARAKTAADGDSVHILQGAEAEQAIKGLALWKAQNYGRMAIALTSWLLGAAAVLLL